MAFPAPLPLALFAASVLIIVMFATMLAGYFSSDNPEGPLVAQLLAGTALAFAFTIRTVIFAVHALSWPQAVAAGLLAAAIAPFAARRLPRSVVEGQLGVMLFGLLLVAGFLAQAVVQ